MIESSKVLELIFDACPSFRAAYAADVADSCEPDEPRLLYVDLGQFARHLLVLLQAGSTSEFPAVFATIERLHRDGAPDVQEAATIGILEAVQNAMNPADSEAFARLLGPESRLWWDELNAFWRGQRPYVGAGPRHD